MDEWPVSISEVRECDQCHMVRPVRLLADPFEREVHDRVVVQWFCLICYQQSIEDT